MLGCAGALLLLCVRLSCGGLLPEVDYYYDQQELGHASLVLSIPDREDGRVGAWCAWRAWTPCSQTKCGTTGHRTRTRDCACPTPSHGVIDIAYQCEGNSQEIETCTNSPCGIVGEWCTWSDWTACSSPRGIRERTRSCNCPAPAAGGASNCVGDRRDFGRCTEGHIHVSGAIVYGGQLLVKNSIVFDGRSIVIDGTYYEGNHCVHGGYVYDGLYIDGRPIVYGYPVGHEVYNSFGVFHDDVLFDGHSIIIGGHSYGSRHVVYGGFEYDGYLVNSLPVVYGHSHIHRAKRSGDCVCTSDYDPVCATNGVTFSNECMLNCQGLEMAYKGRCPGECELSCTREYKPVCGTDGITYITFSNLCSFDNALCVNSDLRLQHWGECGARKKRCSGDMGDSHSCDSGPIVSGVLGRGYGIVGQGIVYGGRQLVNSIVFNGQSIVIDGTVYQGTHCTHNGYVYDARYIGGFPTVFGYPVGYGVYNGYNVFSDNILFDGSSFVIGGRSFAGTHVVHGGFEYNGYLIDNLRVVYGFSTPYLSSFGVTGGGPHVTTGSHVELGHSPGVVTQANTYDQTQSHHSTHQSIDHVHNIDHEIAHHHKVDHHVDHLHHVDHDVHHKHLVDHDVHHKHIVDHDIEHAHTIAHEVSHHDHGTVDIGVVREVSGPTPPALSTPGLGYEFYVPSHFAYDGHRIVIDGTAYEGSHCTHGGYVYDGRMVDGFPTVFGYPVGHGVYNGLNVFGDGINFNGNNLLIGGTSYGARGVSHGGFLYDGYLVDDVRVVYGHPGNYFTPGANVYTT